MRWVTQMGVPIVTASENPAHDLSDMSIFDFELSDEEMAALNKVGPPPKHEDTRVGAAN